MINIRYAQIRECDVSNGEGIGVSLFVQGCQFHCENCFNPDTWDFNGGREWTSETRDKFIELAGKPYITRISILGGEPLAEENLNGVLDLVNEIRISYPQKSIWLYTGYTVYFKETCKKKILSTKNNDNTLEHDLSTALREEILKQCDVVIDGRYIDSQRDITLPYRGSSNQRIISIKESLQNREIIIYEVGV